MTPRWVPVSRRGMAPEVGPGRLMALLRRDGSVTRIGPYGHPKPHGLWANDVTHVCDLGTDPEAVPPPLLTEAEELAQLRAWAARVEEAIRLCDEHGGMLVAVAAIRPVVGGMPPSYGGGVAGPKPATGGDTP